VSPLNPQLPLLAGALVEVELWRLVGVAWGAAWALERKRRMRRVERRSTRPGRIFPREWFMMAFVLWEVEVRQHSCTCVAVEKGDVVSISRAQGDTACGTHADPQRTTCVFAIHAARFGNSIGNNFLLPASPRNGLGTLELELELSVPYISFRFRASFLTTPVTSAACLVLFRLRNGYLQRYL
jgi:hypothetical protein